MLNLSYFRVFAKECPDRKIGQQTADQLPWFHAEILKDPYHFDFLGLGEVL